MKQANLMHTLNGAPVQSYIVSIIKGIKGAAMPDTALELPEETTTFENISHTLIMRLSHKMDGMDKPTRLRSLLA